MIKNKIREARMRLGLSQAEVAKRAGTSQQQIQRIEAGHLRARIDLATNLSKALGQPINKLFPGADRAVKIAVGQAKSGWLPSDSTFEKLGDTGIELDPRKWYFRFLLRGHTDPFVDTVSAQEKRRLWQNFQDEESFSNELLFVVYDTQTERVALSLADVVYCHFLFDPVTVSPRKEEPSEVSVYFSGINTRHGFRVEPDEIFDDDGEEMGEFAGIFFDLDSIPESRHRLLFEDEDGEYVLLRTGDVALLRVPLWVVEPELGEDEPKPRNLQAVGSVA